MAFFYKLKNKAAFREMIEIMKSADCFEDFTREMQKRGMVIKGEIPFYFKKGWIPVEILDKNDLLAFLQSVEEIYPLEFMQIEDYIRSSQQGVKVFEFGDKSVTIIKDKTIYGLVSWR